MKKIYLLLLVLATVFVACKKDRDVEFSTFEVEDETIIPSYTSTFLMCKVRCAATINQFYLQYDTVADFSTYQEVELVEDEKTEVYSVKIGDLLDNTTYYVRYVAVNSYSQVTSEEVSEFKTLQATAPTIEVREITDVLDTIVTVGFVLKFDGGADVSKMGVCWSVDSVPKIDDVHVECSSDVVNSVSDGDSLVLEISGLEANTKYYVRAYAENKIGVGYSDSKEFVTLALPEVETEDVTDIQLTSASLNGLLLFNGNDTTVEYGFCWGEESDLTIGNSQIVKSGIAEDSTFTYRLSDLKDETKYYVRAYAKNKIGLVYGEEKEFITQSTILAVVVTAEALDVTYTSAKVGGKVEADGGSNVTERGICYSTTKSPTIDNNKVVLGNGLGSFTTELSDLQDGTRYYVRAYAINKKGVSYGETMEFETKAYSLAEVITSSPTEITYTSAIVGGTVVSDGGVEVEERGICYSATENPTIANSKIVVNKGLGSFSATLSGLQDGTKYYVKAYAINQKGVVYGDEVIFETLSRFVDLGLSVKWATCNIGANKPEEYGDYFAWGEVTPQSNYDWSTYKYCKGTRSTLTKYCFDSSDGYNGFKDDNVVLDLGDDAAYVNWGNCRMPTKAELDELQDKCTWTWFTQNGVSGYLIVGPNGNSIFLPAGGVKGNNTSAYVNEGIVYWSSCLFYNSSSATVLQDRSLPIEHTVTRSFGKTVRAVQEKTEQSGVNRCVISVYSNIAKVQDIVSGSGTYEVGAQVELTAQYYLGEAYIFVKWSDGNTDLNRVVTASKDAIYVAEYTPCLRYNGHSCVDLGLSVKWATCNVGATKPEEYGDYFAWGEVATKTIYDYSTYKYCSTIDGFTKYCSDGEYGVVDNKKTLDLEDDAAYVNWGEAWRMPTYTECNELKNKCTWERTVLNGVDGFKVIGTNGNSIFLPMARKKVGINSYPYGGGWYWAADKGLYFDNLALYLSLEGTNSDTSREHGLSIRPVCE